ncbi:Hypothetical_protein [Hexamita inflata]|uniref:Hypothetical_protein n=1 Tax=Hexamita inflata TaxID=28002 RepID=A0AA86NCN4_9EUKA|nr:Hypothetical protein HINF_LOCUS4466 [Hexamita inflata]
MKVNWTILESRVDGDSRKNSSTTLSLRIVANHGFCCQNLVCLDLDEVLSVELDVADVVVSFKAVTGSVVNRRCGLGSTFAELVSLWVGLEGSFGSGTPTFAEWDLLVDLLERDWSDQIAQRESGAFTERLIQVVLKYLFPGSPRQIRSDAFLELDRSDFVEFLPVFGAQLAVHQQVEGGDYFHDGSLESEEQQYYSRMYSPAKFIGTGILTEGEQVCRYSTFGTASRRRIPWRSYCRP